MESLDIFVVDLALILCVASIAAVILKKLKQPVVLGYIVAGFLISPNFTWLPTVVSQSDITVWANIGVIFLMFGLGLEFNLNKIAEVGKSAIITATTVVTAMVVIGYSVGLLLGWSTMTSIFLGGMLSLSSTMIILKSYEEMGLKNTKFAELVMGIMVIEDIVGIFMMIILSTISVSKGTPDAISLIEDIGMLLLYLVAWYVLSVYIIPSFMKKADSVINDEVLLLISVTVCFVMVFVANQIGFSSALGAFLGGSIISGTVYGERTEHLVKPLKDIFGAIFFVSVGMMVVPSMLVEYLVPILILTVVTIAGQLLFATLGMVLSGQSLHTSIRGGFSMVQIGEFSFILANLGSDLGVIDDFLYPVVVCISIITTFTTPFFIKSAEPAYQWLEAHLPERLKSFREKYGNKEDAEQQADESDWKRYLKRVFNHTLLYASLIGIVYFIGYTVIAPFIQQYSIGVEGDIATSVIIIVFMLPFIVRLCTKRSRLRVKLWISDPKNRLPIITLQALQFIYAMAFVVITLSTFFPKFNWVFIPVAIVVIVVAIRSDFVYDNTLKLELKFVANMNEKTLEEARMERQLGKDYSWLDERVFVRRIRVPESWDGMLLLDFHKKAYKNINVIRAVRGKEEYLMPNAEFTVKPGDLLDIMGMEENLDPCINMLVANEGVTTINKSSISLHKYVKDSKLNQGGHETKIICCPIKIGENSEFHKKTIRTSGFREKYKGFIIGIERGNLPICNPNLRMSIEKGDLLWVVGDKEMADQLLIAGYLGNVL